MSKPTGGQAFPGGEIPVGGDGVEPREWGMTRRQWYAGHAAQGILASALPGMQQDTETIARRAWAIADALIATEEE